MKNLSFVEIWYPSNNANAKVLIRISQTIRAMLDYAKRYKAEGEKSISNYLSWEFVKDEYNKLVGECEMLATLEIISWEDRYRIPYIAYNVALKYAGKFK